MTIIKEGIIPQRGTALIMAILVLLVLTIIGTYAITTSTIETRISGFEREFKEAFYTADSGEPIGIKVTKIIIHETPSTTGDLSSPWDAVTDSSLLTEIFQDKDPNDQNDPSRDNPNDSPDIDSQGDSANLGLPSSVRLRIDIDRLETYQMAGGATEFGSGYEGIGKGSGGGVGIIFAMDSLGEYKLGEDTLAESEIESGYLHVVGIPGGK